MEYLLHALELSLLGYLVFKKYTQKSPELRDLLVKAFERRSAEGVPLTSGRERLRARLARKIAEAGDK